MNHEKFPDYQHIERAHAPHRPVNRGKLTTILMLLTGVLGTNQAVAFPGFGNAIDSFCADNGYTLLEEFQPQVAGNCLACHDDGTGGSGAGKTAYEDNNFEFFCPPPPPNTPPIADAGAGQTVNSGDTVTLDGSGSSDADGDPLTYQWSLTTPPGSLAALSDPAAVMPTFTTDVAGDYVGELVVNDGADSSFADAVVITTAPGNSPPVADAGNDQSVTVGAIVNLDGSGSSDVDGDTMTYLWSLMIRPAGSAAVLSNDMAVMPSFMADVAGEFTLQLVVNDGMVDSDPATVMIVAGAGNTAPVADAGANQAVTVGDDVSLDGSGSSDVDGDALTYQWSLTAQPAGSTATLANAETAMPGFKADVAGDYVAQLIVNDGTIDSLPATVTITAAEDNDGNVAPAADAGPDQKVNLASAVRVQLDGSGSTDPNGDPLTYSWTVTAWPQGSAAMLSDSMTMMPVLTVDTVGEYVVQLIVNDGMLDSDPDAVMVMAEPDIVPSPTGGCDLALYPDANVIYGTPGNDRLRGTSGVDVIFGMEGDDHINGGDGDDCIDGGPDNDRLKGGDDDDHIYGGDGRDSIGGGDGEDALYGGPGDDRIGGGDDNDSLDGGPDNDRLNGGDGENTCVNGESGKNCDGMSEEEEEEEDDDDEDDDDEEDEDEEEDEDDGKRKGKGKRVKR